MLDGGRDQVMGVVDKMIKRKRDRGVPGGFQTFHHSRSRYNMYTNKRYLSPDGLVST